MKLYVNNASFICNQSAKFQSNLSKQTIATVPFVRSPQNTRVSGFCGCRQFPCGQTKRSWVSCEFIIRHDKPYHHLPKL